MLEHVFALGQHIALRLRACSTLDMLVMSFMDPRVRSSLL